MGFLACNIISEVKKILVMRKFQILDFKDDIKTVDRVHSWLSTSGGSLRRFTGGEQGTNCGSITRNLQLPKFS